LVTVDANFLAGLYLHDLTVMNHHLYRTVFDTRDSAQDLLFDIHGDPFASLCLRKIPFFQVSNFYVFGHFVSLIGRGTAASYQPPVIIETNIISFVYLFFAYVDVSAFNPARGKQ